MSLIRLWNTTKHLRGRQILGQLRVRLHKVYQDPSAFFRQEEPSFPGCRWQPKGDFLAPGMQDNRAADITSGRLRFLNRTEDVGWPPRWPQHNLPRLWQYNLHYFEYLWALDYPQARAVVLDWIERHELRKGCVGWESYPTSLRLMNWCCLFFGRFRQRTEADRRFCTVLWRSIFIQTEWLHGHIETHLMGNHLFENGAALTAVGCCFAGPAAMRWYRRGKSILAGEIDEQILPDGGHFERSPMYHSRALYVLLLLMNLGDPSVIRLTRSAAGKMVKALADMCHPDGQIALFNDSAFGIYNVPSELISYANRILHEPAGNTECSTGAFALPASGYYGFRHEGGSYLICDVGSVGPDYTPGHAHGDIFSFELSLKGHRVIVDSGVHDYERGQMRRYCRSTKAHNTVEIDGRDQCEFWAGFRVAKRGQPHQIRRVLSQRGFRLSGWHDGYRRLKGKPKHYREFTWNDPGVLIVRDTVVSSRSVTAVSRLHLHPECNVLSIEQKTATVTFPGGWFRVCFTGPGKMRLGRSVYCPKFGIALENGVLEFESTGRQITSGICVLGDTADVGPDSSGGITVNRRRSRW